MFSWCYFVVVVCCIVFFFKQKTAYEMRISDWSSDVCSSDLVVARRQATVSAKITGKLQDLYIEEGQKVAEGDVMARLDDSNAKASLLQAQANLAAAKAAAANIKPIYERDKKQAAANFKIGRAHV